MKKIVIIFLSAAINCFASSYSPIILNAEIIRNLDGVHHVLDGNMIKFEYQIIEKIMTITQGELNTKTKKRNGVLMHNNAKRNLKQLLIEELRLTKELAAMGISMKDAYQSPHALPKALQDKVMSLNLAFMQAKTIFKEATFPFLSMITHFRAAVIDLMQDCCTKRNKQQSLLLKWAEAAGNEEAVYHRYMTTIGEFDAFLGDLVVFLRDLIHNCPRAKKQFEEWYLKK